VPECFPFGSCRNRLILIYVISIHIFYPPSEGLQKRVKAVILPRVWSRFVLFAKFFYEPSEVFTRFNLFDVVRIHCCPRITTDVPLFLLVNLNASSATSWRVAHPLSTVFSFPISERGCPILAFFARVGCDAADSIMLAMPRGLHRYYGADHMHFITCSCYRRLPLLRSARSRDRLLSVLEQTRQRYRFVVVGYVVMPEHIHLLLSEPEVGTPSTVMQVLKQRTARALLPKTKSRDPRQIKLFGEMPVRAPLWRARFHDFNVWTEKKRVEKLRYMHRNPLKRGLTAAPEDWRWSSYRFYFLDESGPVRVNEGWGKISFRAHAA
jgi:putative transposase